ncbi:MAG TPA: rod shape-determining protein MreC [Candidatus Acidoferrales bacterium]|nr:rod shape-determining protein MreC [Candidatus Acidoferrales bacterium]
MTALAPRRPLLLLAAVVGAQVLLLAFQIRRDRNIRLIRVWAVETLTPAERAGTNSIDWMRELWSGYIDLRRTRADNRRLRGELDQLRLQMVQLQSRADEAGRLAGLLAFRQAHTELPLLAARVISASPAATTRVVYIDRGWNDGVRGNMGVITPDGVVGKILDVYPASSQVLLVTDRESGVGALLAGTRTEGVVKGTGGPDLSMDFVVSDEKVPAGEPVLTSGLDQIFPKGLPVGTVVSTRPANPFQKISLRPAARLDRLEEVLVIELHPKPPSGPPTAGDTTAGRNR